MLEYTLDLLNCYVLALFGLSQVLSLHDDPISAISNQLDDLEVGGDLELLAMDVPESE